MVQLLVKSMGAAHWVLHKTMLPLPSLARLVGEGGGGLHPGANKECMCLFHAQQDRSIQASWRHVLIPKGAATPSYAGSLSALGLIVLSSHSFNKHLLKAHPSIRHPGT